MRCRALATPWPRRAAARLCPYLILSFNSHSPGIFSSLLFHFFFVECLYLPARDEAAIAIVLQRSSRSGLKPGGLPRDGCPVRPQDGILGGGHALLEQHPRHDRSARPHGRPTAPRGPTRPARPRGPAAVRSPPRQQSSSSPSTPSSCSSFSARLFRPPLPTKLSKYA